MASAHDVGLTRYWPLTEPSEGNQGTLYADVELPFQWADEQWYQGMAHITHETQTTSHGRVERRRTTVTDALGRQHTRVTSPPWGTRVSAQV